MKKLTIKELACYLPYGLKMIFEKSGRIIALAGIELAGKGDIIFIDTDKNTYRQSIYNFKPLLRNLSDLTKTIEVNGEKFVPLQKLAENYWLLTDSSHPFYFRTMDGEDAIDYLNDNKPEWWTANVRDIAISWHFDVFGLIENGLAVDINSLTKSAA